MKKQKSLNSLDISQQGGETVKSKKIGWEEAAKSWNEQGGPFDGMEMKPRQGICSSQLCCGPTDEHQETLYDLV